MSAISQPAIEYKFVKFEDQIASQSHHDLKVFKPHLPVGWCYLGPVATSDKKPEQQGMIVKAVDQDALADIVDWKKVGPNNEPEPPPPYSTWRGIAPDGYVVVGDFFVNGNDKPSPKQTVGMKAIRRDLVGLETPDRFIWEGRQPFSVVTLWDVFVTILIYIPTGAFVSTADTSADSAKLALLVFSIAKYSLWCVSSIYRSQAKIDDPRGLDRC